ncbi:class I SAM-dependent methyltransferase [Bradyrhizobium sp. ISRA442]|uniref:class I SAM-dependent methyltransferase n=1 Tax=Bradyrhizobium sp. ISRA442 TaxID=2866197 RepID=UPI00311AC67A
MIFSAAKLRSAGSVMLYQKLKSKIPAGAKRVMRRALGIPASFAGSKSYNRINAEDAAARVNISTARVLVVGANTGEDCREFIELGAAEVHGLDVISEIGSAFAHNRVTYHRQSIEKADLPSRSFDLVYSFATMEHVPDIAAGYSEMARLVKPGGTIFSMASPLWYSPYGHHMSCFHGHPWVHVAFDRAGILDYARANKIDGERGHGIEGIVDYMLDASNFNMRHAREYDDAIRSLRNLEIIENSLLEEDQALLDHPLGQRLLASGFSRNQLLPVTHRLIAIGR